MLRKKRNTLVLSGKAVRFTPDMAYLEKMLAKMKPGETWNEMPGAAGDQQYTSVAVRRSGSLIRHVCAGRNAGR